jgi:hypothetical protein
MSHKLDGPALKIRRAKGEIDVLAQELGRAMKEANYQAVRAEINPKTQKQVYRVRVGKSFPLELGVLIGEIAHNLRSALDGLVWQLATLNLPKGETPASFNQFPVFRSGRAPSKKVNPRRYFDWVRGEKLQRGTGRYMIQQLCPDHQAVIERLQPYHRIRGGKESLPWLLHELNNADKHRTLQVIAGTGGGYLYQVVGNSNSIVRSPARIFKDGTKLCEGGPDVTVGPGLAPLVLFWEGCEALKGYPVVLTLRQIAEQVREIAAAFMPAFS